MEIINQIQREVIEFFPQIADSERFYLTGGTALSYFYLKHRRSNDLDFFTSEEEIILPFSYRIEEGLKVHKADIQRQRGLHSFVELLVEKGRETTIIHLAVDAAFHLQPLKEFAEYPGLKIDSLDDIAVNKLLALFGRATLRDFIDVYFLVRKSGFKPEELLAKAKIKDPGFDLYWLGVALERINTFNNNSPEMFLLTTPLAFEDILSFFNQWRREIATKIA